MPQPVKKDIWFDSADGTNRVAGFFYTCEGAKPFCVVQIAHGMCEYMGRYDDFACFLAKAGIAVCGNDHLGHGATAQTEDELGYFGKRGSRRFAIRDMKTMNEQARAAFPGLPVVLLGHSMGSFFSRRYAVEYPESIDGLILSGTGGPNPMAGVGIALAALLMRTKGARHRSPQLHYMTFGSYLKQIPAPATPYDWVSRDAAIAHAYAMDPLCNFRFTASGFHELYSALREVSSPKWAIGVRKDMPVLMIQGDGDPVGDYGRGTETVRAWLRGAGVKHVEYILYPGGRHEMLNEINRAEVYEDVLAFLQKWWGAALPKAPARENEGETA